MTTFRPLNYVRKVLGLAPYHTKPTMSNFNDKDFVTMTIAATPMNTVTQTADGRWTFDGTDKSYSRKADATRGYRRFHNI